MFDGMWLARNWLSNRGRNHTYGKQRKHRLTPNAPYSFLSTQSFRDCRIDIFSNMTSVSWQKWQGRNAEALYMPRSHVVSLKFGRVLRRVFGDKTASMSPSCLHKIISLSTSVWTWPNPNLSGVKAPKNREVSCKVIDRVLVAHWMSRKVYLWNVTYCTFEFERDAFT
jgi:hypothetical protein